MRNSVTVQWDLYKPGSGKWAYGGTAAFDAPAGYVDNAQLLCLIAANQNEVTPKSITEGGYVVVIKETPECMQNPDYKGFLCRLVSP